MKAPLIPPDGYGVLFEDTGEVWIPVRKRKDSENGWEPLRDKHGREYSYVKRSVAVKRCERHKAEQEGKQP